MCEPCTSQVGGQKNNWTSVATKIYWWFKLMGKKRAPSQARIGSNPVAPPCYCYRFCLSSPDFPFFNEVTRAIFHTSQLVFIAAQLDDFKGKKLSGGRKPGGGRGVGLKIRGLKQFKRCTRKEHLKKPNKPLLFDKQATFKLHNLTGSSIDLRMYWRDMPINAIHISMLCLLWKGQCNPIHRYTVQ